MTTPHRATPSDWAWLEGNSTCDRCDAAWSRGLIELRARVEALEAAQHAPTTTEARPGGLVERVAEALADEFQPSGTWHDEARAAIREVAAWLRAGRMLHAAELLEQEVDR
jgi:hypothetical protein